jgi:hypothetical protein
MKPIVKAKSIKWNRFVEGYYVCIEKTTLCNFGDISEEQLNVNSEHYVYYDSMTDWNLPNEHHQELVYADTVCMCSNMIDNNQHLIYENDIVRCGGKHGNGIVKFNDGCFDIEFEDGFRDYLKCYVANHSVTIIGNIFD